MLAVKHDGFQSDQGAFHLIGVTKYLTNIISSPLAWLDNDDDRETIWSTASQCMSQR